MSRVTLSAKAAGWLFLFLLPSTTVFADDLKAELQRFLHDEATVVMRSRSYLFDRQNLAPPNAAAAVTGGWIGLQTGWFYDALQLGAVGYTTQPLWAPQGNGTTSNGTLLLKPGGYGFFTLGQAYASARWQKQTVTVFRQYLDELEVNPRDDRELPQTFEAYALRGALGPVNYFAGYVAAMKPRDYSAFINMGEAAGTPNVNRGMALFSAKYGSMNDIQVRASTYYVPDILRSSYADVGGTIRVNDDLRVALAAQFAVQGSNGMNLLTGRPFSTFWGGFRADAYWGPVAFRLSYTQIGSAANWRNPYGIFIGYNKMQSLDFNRAGEMAVTAGASYDFKSTGLPGVIFIATATGGSNAVNPATGAGISTNWEYNVELAVRGDAMGNPPDWLRPFNLRNRVAFVDQYEGRTVNSYTEYRIQLNYELTWKGPRLRQ
ncbi:MAG: OprD family outer membrane porin [Reyranella sp.]|nr:OprD family outer membrane porin [Reyranella sp.]